MSVHDDYRESQLTPWFPSGEKPVRAGLYRCSWEHVKKMAWAYSWWNGERWEKYKDWSHYPEKPDFVWRGRLKGARP